MSKEFDSVINKYLIKLKDKIIDDIGSGQYTKELSYHTVIDTFFIDIIEYINKPISGIHEPKKQSQVGHPDWRFHHPVNYGVYGYVEAKGLDISLTLETQEYVKQITKYLSLGHNLIFTDGIDFFYYKSDGNIVLESILQKPINMNNWDDLEINPNLEYLFLDFFKDLQPRKCSEEELVIAIAKRAHELSASISELTDLPINSGLNELENKTIQTLHDLKNLVENHHDPRLRDKKIFADFVSQVLVFGLLYAHRLIHQDHLNAQEKYEKMTSFWFETISSGLSESLVPFKELMNLLESELSSLSSLGTWYQDCALFLAYIDLTDKQKSEPDYHELYEQFLAVFDPQTRFDYGAFYTPSVLAQYIVNLTQAVIRYHLPDSNFYDTRNKIIDPCCGTGTFIEKIILGTKNEELPEITGFEILPAPYALAHYRLTSLDTDSSLENVKLFLTNTLSDELEKNYAGIEASNLIEEELQKASVRSKPPLTLIMGNPPSSDSSVQVINQNISLIQKLVDDFRPPLEERTSRQNIQKQTQNEFVRFLRWSCEKALLSKPSFFSLILPSSFAEHPSYHYSRKWLIDNFNSIWIQDLDKDARTSARNSSLFKTLQGRLLIIGYSGDKDDDDRSCSVYYSSINEFLLDEKINYLEKERTDEEYVDLFSRLNLSETSYCFRPTKDFDQERYSKFWPLYPENKHPQEKEQYIFSRHCSGIKLAPSSLFVHVSKPHLIRRTMEISDLTNSIDDILNRWYLGQDRPPSSTKLTDEIRSNIKEIYEEHQDSRISNYAYRPFLDLHIYLSEKILNKLSKSGGGGTRARPEVLSAFSDSTTIGIAVSPAPKDISDTLHRFVSFCWNLPDNDLSRRGNAHVFCNQFPEYKKLKGNWNSRPQNNINPLLLSSIKEKFDVTPEEVIFYVYAILCSDYFLDLFEGALFTVADPRKRPRIPFISNEALMKKVAELGKDLAELENTSKNVLVPENYLKQKELFDEEFELKTFIIDEDNEKIQLLTDNEVKIEIMNIPREILLFEVSGYNVLQQWLKMHSKRYSRKLFSESDFRKLIEVLYRIHCQLEIMQSLEPFIKEIVSNEELWIL